MPTVSVSTIVNDTPERVWEVVADPHNLINWDRRIAGVYDADSDEIYEGMEYTVDLRLVLVHGHVRARVLEVEAPRSSLIELRGLLDGTVATIVGSLKDGRTRLEHEVDFRFRGPLGELAARSLKMVGGPGHVLRHGILAQKRQIEDGL